MSQILSKAESILISAHVLTLLTQVMLIEYDKELVDARFKNLGINKHNESILKSLNLIKREIKTLFKIKDDDNLNFNYGPEMHRVFNHFALMPIEDVKSFMDGVEEMVKKGVENA